jgi:hypothetical protein
MTKDWSGNSKSTFITIGASNHTDKEREEHDFYSTSPEATAVCKDCVMFADEDADSAPDCLAKNLYTFVMGRDEICEEFVKWNDKK